MHTYTCPTGRNFETHMEMSAQVDEAIHLYADIPGVQKDNINLDVDYNVLTISVDSRSGVLGDKKVEKSKPNAGDTNTILAETPAPGNGDNIPAVPTMVRAEEGARWHRTERSAAFCRRSLRMPEGTDLMSMTASYTDGVLNITVPKLQVPNKRKRVAVE